MADLGVDAEDQLDRAGEIERVVEVAGRAMAVIADGPERVLDLARDPADRAEQVPEQHEQPLARAVQAGGDERIGIEPPGGWARARGRIRATSGSGARGQELAQPLDDGRVDRRASPACRALDPAGPSGLIEPSPAPRRDRRFPGCSSLPVTAASIRR